MIRQFFAASVITLLATPPTLAQTPAETLAIAERFVTGFLGQGDRGVLAQTADPDIRVVTGLKPTGPIEGTEEYAQVLGGFVTGFTFTGPLEIIDSFATPDRAVVRFRVPAIHTGPHLGLEATEQAIVFDETHVMRIQDGRIVENIVSATSMDYEVLFAPALAPLVLQ